MLKKEIKFTDFDGNKAVESHYFNLTETEIVEWESEVQGGLSGFAQKIVDTRDGQGLVKLFKEFIKKTYGERDGNRFIKDEDIWKRFTQTAAYDALYMELATDADAASKFIIGVLPEKHRGLFTEQANNSQAVLPPPPPQGAA